MPGALEDMTSTGVGAGPRAPALVLRLAERRWWPSSLRGRLLAGGILLQAAVLLTAAAAVAWLVGSHLERQLEARLEQMKPLLNAALSAPMAQRDYATVESILAELSSAKDLSFLCVLDTGGRVIGEVRAPTHSKGAPGPVAGAELAKSKSDRGGIRAVAPLAMAGQPLGRVEFALSRSEIDATRVAIVRDVLGISAGALALFALLLTGIGYAMTRPLQALVVAARDLRAGNHDIELDTARGDEIGVLARALDKLSAEVRRKVAELTRSESRQRRLFLDAVESQRQTQQALQAAETANRAKSDFLANVSHEIRTPLNAIVGQAELLLLRAPLTPQQQEQLRAVHAAGVRLLSVVNDVLDFSKIEAGRMEARAEPLDLLDTVEQVVALYQTPLRERGLGLRLEVGPGVPRHIRADGQRLQQVLSNLLGNAAKFTQEGGIELHLNDAPAADVGHRLVLKVCDTGIGIAADQLERIFEPFSQADGSITRRFGGTGLGLTISRHLAGLMGGSLTASSEPGRGSTFLFVLPYERVDDARTGGAHPTSRAADRAQATHAVAPSPDHAGDAQAGTADAAPALPGPLPPQARALLEELARGLRLNLMSARRVAEQIEAQLAGTAHATGFAPVAAQARRLRFPEALEALQTFMQPVQRALPREAT